MPGLDWLTAQPVAHRGLHDAAAGVIENTASAFRAAIEGGFAIETDLQLSADGEAMVHHDFALGRLTLGVAPARRHDGRRTEGGAVQGHRRPDDDARRACATSSPAACRCWSS